MGKVELPEEVEDRLIGWFFTHRSDTACAPDGLGEKVGKVLRGEATLPERRTLLQRLRRKLFRK